MNEAAREVSDVGADDIVLPYAVESLSTRGRVVRLGPAIDAIIKRHDYPEPVSRLLAEAATLAVLLGASLKLEGRFQLQTKTAGPVGMLLVDFDAPSNLRALARFDAAALAALPASAGAGALLGEGYLAFTSIPAATCRATRASSRWRGRTCRTPPTFISTAPSRFRRWFGSPSARA